jgi:hypothetical protein
MAHFAELDEQNRVVRVVVVANAAITVGGVEDERLGVDLLEKLHGHRRWKQTSYSGAIRKNYAGAGMTYDASRDAFLPRQPFPSWTIDEQTCRYVPPVRRPENGLHKWSEEERRWIPVTPLPRRQ